MLDTFIQKTAREAGKITLKYFKKAKVEYTKRHALDVVTKADLESNKYIVDAIKAKFPNDGFISEEMGEDNPNAESIWIIDPLDGTLNFSKGIPIYCILIAHANKGVVDCGVICDPVHDEMYFASKGKGAFLNGVKILCSEADSIEESVGCIGGTINNVNLDILNKFRKSTENSLIRLTSLYSIGICTAQVSSGKKDWYLSASGSGSVWDYAAGTVILAESGCRVTNIRGEQWKLFDKGLLAANPKLHKKLLDAIKMPSTSVA